jgi:hypothetical protein
MSRAAVVAAVLVCAACGLVTRHTAGASLRGYDLLIETHDSLSDALARELARKGFPVRRRLRGGGPPTVALVTFTFRELGESPILWFNARWADTRSGAIVAAVSAPLDSLGATPVARARSLADSFAARRDHPLDVGP